MKKILVCVDSLSVGGVTAVVKSIYENIDKKEFLMDFMAVRQLDNDFEKQIVANGDKLYFLNDLPLDKIPVLNYKIQSDAMCRQIRRVIKKGEYDAVHIHAHPNYYLRAAKQLKIPIRIMHVHEAVSDFNGNEKSSKITDFVWKNRQWIYNKYATVKAGDSLKACVCKFGENIVNDDKRVVIYPSVDMVKFNPRSYDKNAITEQFGIDDNSFNIIHVGRLTPVKNQNFIIEILAALNKIQPAQLYIVGNGSLKQELTDYSSKLGVSDKVHFLPPDTTAGIYTAMDCSLLPSFSEAFGMVAVESQLMGVPCFASDNVPTDVNVGMCEFLDLGLGAEAWAEKIIDCTKDKHTINQKLASQFDIKYIAKSVSDLYSVGKVR